MKSSSCWCMACGLPELRNLGLSENNQLKYMVSQWGSSRPRAPISVGCVLWLTSYLCVDTKGLETASFRLFIFSCFVI